MKPTTSSFLFFCAITSIAFAADPAESPALGTSKAKEITRIVEQAQPKPTGAIPSGWRLEVLKGHTIKQQPSTLPNGEQTTVTTSAYVLVPEEKQGAIVFTDPAFDPKLGNAQKNTIGAVLTDYMDTAAGMTKRLDTAIESLKSALNAPSPTPKFTARKAALPIETRKAVVAATTNPTDAQH